MVQTLKELRASIKKNVKSVDRKPFSHNIISLTLSVIDKHYGREEANQAIEDFDLECLGWVKEKLNG